MGSTNPLHKLELISFTTHAKLALRSIITHTDLGLRIFITLSKMGFPLKQTLIQKTGIIQSADLVLPRFTQLKTPKLSTLKRKNKSQTITL